MNVFVVARDAGQGSTDELVRKLGAIQVESSVRNSIVAVDSTYNLPVGAHTQPDCSREFWLDDFVHAKGSVADGKVVLDTNRIADQTGSVTSEWLVVDFGQHEFETGEDFISKLSKCFFALPPSRQLKLVLIVPRVKLPLYLRACNSAFNILPEARGFSARSTQTDMLFLSVAAEKVYLSASPVLWPVAKLRELLRFFYIRIVRARS